MLIDQMERLHNNSTKNKHNKFKNNYFRFDWLTFGYFELHQALFIFNDVVVMLFELVFFGINFRYNKINY